MLDKVYIDLCDVMDIMKNKEGKFNASNITTAIMAIIVLVVLFNIYSATIPLAATAGEDLNASNRCAATGCFYNLSTAVCQNSSVNAIGCTATNYESPPLSGLIGSGGLVFVVVMAAFLILIVRSHLKNK